MSDRVFTINVDGKMMNVSVDRLKPAYFTPAEYPQETTSATLAPEPSADPSNSEQSVNILPQLKTYPGKVKKTVRFK